MSESPDAPFFLGPFLLDRVIGTGGMGQVWRGVHRDEGSWVAVKVLTPRVAANPKYHAWFRNEVRSVAGLSHPNIIGVFDYGRVDAATAAGSGGRAEEGSPWLAMELCSEGSLLDWRGPITWPQLRAILISLLDALAHAHARGVIHRDLKGANVLLSGAQRRVKLADFGLANPAFEMAGVEQDRAAGTPWYMAPEQFTGSRRDQGPWTDLYALGCLAWTMVTGRPPFPGQTWADTRYAHLTAPPPAFEPRVQVPRRLEDWLRILLEKRPEDRFHCAADAAYALLSLDVAAPDAPVPVGPPPPVPEEVLEQTWSLPSGEWPIPQETRSIAKVAGPRRAFTTPPLPTDWRQREPDGSHAPLSLGLGLYGLRNIPMVDRDEARDALWQALRTVRVEGQPRLVILRGAAGCGKSRIAQWISERASEVGGAVALRAVHGAAVGTQAGLGPMIGRFLRGTSLSRVEALAHLEGELPALGVTDRQEILAIAEIVAPADESIEPPFVRFEGSSERYAVIQRFLGRLCAERPVILWLDDAHLAVESLAFVAGLLDTASRGLPVLAVVTAREEDLPLVPIADGMLEHLAGHARAQSIDVLPLDGVHRADLVRRLLGLDAELSRQIEDRTAGNPLFAVQLVGNLVQRGLLEPGPKGYRTRPGATVELPDDLRQVWRDRTGRLLDARPASDRHALRLAAVLGQDVEPLEWHALCVREGIPVPDGLIDELVSERLAVAEEGGTDVGWSFVHGMLRETLLDDFQKDDPEGFRRANLHVAALVEDSPDPTRATRAGRHLLAAGESDRALAALYQSASSREIDPRLGEALLVDRDRVMTDLGIPESDRRWCEGFALRAEIHVREGREAKAAEDAARALALAEAGGFLELAAQSLATLAEVARLKHRFAQSLQLRRRSVRAAIDAGDVTRHALGIAGIGRLYLDFGNWEQARAAYIAALEVAQTHALPAIEAECWTGAGYAAVKLGAVGESLAAFRAAERLVASAGTRLQRANLSSALADLARKRGDFAEAEARCREALRDYLATGTRAARVVQLNLSLFLVLQAKYAEARQILTRALEDPGEGPEAEAFRAGCLSTMLPCLASAREWDAFYRTLRALEGAVSEEAFVDDDTLVSLRLAAQLARDAKRGEAAGACMALHDMLANPDPDFEETTIPTPPTLVPVRDPFSSPDTEET